MNKIKRIFSILSIILIIIFAIVYIYHYTKPKEIYIKTEGVIFRLGDENQFLEKTEIELVGEIKRHLFEDPLFTGKIKFDGNVLKNHAYEFSLNERIVGDKYEIFNFFLWKDKISKSYIGSVNSHYYNSNVDKPLKISDIHINKEYDKLCLTIVELCSKSENGSSYGWNSGTGLVFASPAATRDEALEIAKHFLEWPGINPLK